MATPRALFQDLSSGKFKPVYYFYGQEDYRISEAVKFVSRQFLPDRQLAVNYRKLDGKKTKAGDLINELATLPMLGEKQVFVITDIQSYKPTELKQVLALLTPADNNRLIIFCSPSSKPPNKKASFFKSITAVAEAVEFSKLTLAETQAQINHKLKNANLTISGDAQKLLGEMIAGNRGGLESELAKLIDYKNKGERIELDDVKKVCNGYEVFKVFDLADRIIEGKTSQVLKMIKSLLVEGVSPATITTLLQQHFSSLYLIKNNHKPIGNRSFLIYKFKPQAARYSNSRLEEIIIEIAKSDALLRHQGMKPEMTLENLAIRLTGEQAN